MRAMFSLLLLCSCTAGLAQVPPAGPAASDPPPDLKNPARMAVVHIPTHGVQINGLLYIAAGAAAHPTAILFHGMPGNEQNLDLAQAIRRAGWNVLTLHYRGSWGSPGKYSYRHLIEDGSAALAFARDGHNASLYTIDPQRIVLVGHSSGGFVAVQTAAAHAKDLAGMALISASDDAADAVAAHKDAANWPKWVKENFTDSMETLSGCTPQGLADEVLANAAAWSFANAAPHLTSLPLLLISSDDGYAPDADALATAIGKHGGAAPQRVHMKTDHPYSDHRLALQATVVDWLQHLAAR